MSVISYELSTGATLLLKGWHAEVKLVADVLGIVLSGVLNQLGRDGIGDVHLAVVVHAVLGVEVAGGKVANAIKPA